MCFSVESKTLPILKNAKLRNLGKIAGGNIEKIIGKEEYFGRIGKNTGKVLI